MNRWIAVAVVSLLTIGIVVVLEIRSNEARERACEPTVLVSKVDIPPNVDLNPYIDAGDFTVRCGGDLIVEGAITETSELRDQRTSAAIYAGEQIPTTRLAGSG